MESRKGNLQEEQTIQAELDEAQFESEKAARDANFMRMSELRYGIIPELEKRLQTIRENNAAQTNRQLVRNRVTEKKLLVLSHSGQVYP